MIYFCLMIIGITILSIIISLIIAYLAIKLMMLIGERYIFRSSNQVKNKARTKRENADYSINLVEFLENIYYFLHLSNIWSRFRDAFRVSNVNSAVGEVNTDKKNECHNESDNTCPKTLSHSGRIINEPSTKCKQNRRRWLCSNQVICF